MGRRCAWLVFAMFVVGAAGLLLAQSSSYEEWEKRTFEKQPPDVVMAVAGIEPGMVVGEVGAGRGRFTMHLARRVGPGGKVFANDIDGEALAFLAQRCEKTGVRNVETILAAGGDPGFRPGSLDMAFMVWVYHYVEPPVALALLRNLKPALRPGATVVLVEPDPARAPHSEGSPVTPDRVRRDAEETGFEVVRIDTRLPEDLIVILRPKPDRVSASSVPDRLGVMRLRRPGAGGSRAPGRPGHSA